MCLNMQKGFSLFTPLVGTAIFIMAIVASVTMMQSDARISMGLAKSYEISSQEIVAKLIKATAETQILANLKLDTLRDLASGYTLTCDSNDASASDCSSKAESAMLNSLLGIKANLFRGLSEAFENIMCTQCSVEMFESLMSDTIRNLPALDVEFDAGHLKETIESSALSGYEDIFSITFTDARGNTIQIPIIPHDFSYKTDDKIQDFIQATADSFVALKGVSPTTSFYDESVEKDIENSIKNYFNPCAGFGKIEELNTFVDYQGSAINDIFLEVRWRVEGGNTLYLKMCDPVCVDPNAVSDGYLVKQLTCHCSGGNLNCA